MTPSSSRRPRPGRSRTVLLKYAVQRISILGLLTALGRIAKITRRCALNSLLRLILAPAGFVALIAVAGCQGPLLHSATVSSNTIRPNDQGDLVFFGYSVGEIALVSISLEDGAGNRWWLRRDENAQRGRLSRPIRWRHRARTTCERSARASRRRISLGYSSGEPSESKHRCI